MEQKPEIKREDKLVHRNNDRRHKSKKKFGKSSNGVSNFNGNCPDLAGYTYSYDPSTRADQFERTTEYIAEYLKKDSEFPNDLAKCIMTREEPDTDAWMPKPRQLTDAERTAEENNPELKKMMEQVMGEKVKEWMLRKRKFGKNKCHAFTLVYGQCSPALKSKLKGVSGWEDTKNNSDLVNLLRSIKVLMLNHQDTCYPTLSVLVTLQTLFKRYQFRHETLEDYRTKFEATVEVIKHVGVDFAKCLTKLTNDVLTADNLSRNTATQDQISEAETKAYEKFLAVMFIKGADKARYESIMTHYENMYSNGTDQYPTSVTEAYNRLINWKRDNKVNETPYNDGVSFAQGTASSSDDKKKPEYDRSDHVCHACGKKGHHAWERKCKAEDLMAIVETLNAMVDEQDIASDHSHDESHGYDHEQGDESDDGRAIDESADEKEDDVCNAMTLVSLEETAAEPLEAFEFAFCTADLSVDDVNVGHIHSQDGQVKKDIQTNSFNEGRASVIPKGSIGLDSMSSVDLFGDRNLLTDIETVSDYIRIVCNAGTVMVTQMGTFSGYGKVWYHPGAIANILSLSNVQAVYHVTYDSHDGNQFVVHRDDGTKRIFRPTKKGLYASEVVGTRRGVALVNTVKENSESYTKREVKRATESRRLMSIIGRPSERQMIDIINKRLIPNCTVTEQDITNAREIFGPDVGSLKGKTVRRKEPHVELRVRPIPDDIMKRHREVVVCFDVMYVNNITFLVSISRALKFCTAEALANRRAATLLIGMSRIKASYATRGFTANRAMGDNEFEALRPGLAEMGIMLNVVARDEHVPEIERHIRTVKERCRAIYNTLPFTRIPARMISELVYNVTFWLNSFPVADGISSTRSPRELVSGTMLDGARHCVLPFGAYVQTHEEHDNTMTTRTIGAIALRPTGNAQGGHYFMSLQSGRRLIRNRWTEVPMPADVVTQVNAMAESPAYNRLVFGDRENAETHESIDPDDDASVSDSTSDEDDSGNSDPDSDSEDGDDSGDASRRLHDQEHDAEARDDGHSQAGGNTRGDHNLTLDPATIKQEPMEASTEERRVRFAANDELMKTLPQGDGGMTQVQQEPTAGDSVGLGEPGDSSGQYQNSGTQSVNGSNHSAGDNANPENSADITGVETGSTTLAAEMDERYGARSGTRGLRPRRRPLIDYKAPQRPAAVQLHESLGGAFAQLSVEADNRAIAPTYNVCDLAAISPTLEPLLGTILTQYGMRRGLKIFGKDGDDAVKAELLQLHNREVLCPRSGRGLSKSDRRAALHYLMFLKQKRSGNIKGRGCADGRKQRTYMSKEESSSPTIATEAVFLIITIAAK